MFDTDALYTMMDNAINTSIQNNWMEENTLLNSACHCAMLSTKEWIDANEYKTQFDIEHTNATNIFVQGKLQMISFHFTSNIYKCIYSNEDIKMVKQIKDNISKIATDLKKIIDWFSPLCSVANHIINYSNEEVKSEEFDIYANNIMYNWQSIIGCLDTANVWLDRITCYIDLMIAYKIAQSSLAKYKCEANYSFLDRLNVIIRVHIKIVKYDYVMKKSYQRLADIGTVNLFSSNIQKDLFAKCSTEIIVLASYKIRAKLNSLSVVA